MYIYIYIYILFFFAVYTYSRRGLFKHYKHAWVDVTDGVGANCERARRVSYQWHVTLTYIYFFFLSFIYILAEEGLGTVDTHNSMSLIVLGRCVGGNTHVPQQCSVALMYTHTLFFFATYMYSRWWGFEKHLHTWFDACDGAGERTNGILRQLSVALIHIYTYFLVLVAYLHIF